MKRMFMEQLNITLYSKKYIFLFLLIFIIPFIFPASDSIFKYDASTLRYNVPENESLRSVGRVYSTFPFTCDIKPSDYLTCGAFVTDFCVDTQTQVLPSIQPLTSEEKDALSEPLVKLKVADENVRDMKDNWCNNLIKKQENCTFTYLVFTKYPYNEDNLIRIQSNSYEDIPYILDYLKFKSNLEYITLLPSYKNVEILVKCETGSPGLLAEILVLFDRYTEHQAAAYNNAGEALNGLLDKLTYQTDSLYYEGAGYKNYSTSASSFYNEKIKSFILNSKLNKTSLDKGDVSYSDLSPHYVFVRETSRKIVNEKVSLPDCEIAVMSSPSYIISFNYLIDLYRQTLNERAKLMSDYNSIHYQATTKFNDATSRYDYLLNQNYHKVNSKIISYVYNKSQETSLESVQNIPSDSIALMKEYLYGSGSIEGANNLIYSAENGVENRIPFFYAIGMEKMSKSILLSENVINESYKVEATVDEVLNILNQQVKNKLDIAYANITKYPVYDANSNFAYQELNSNYNKASEIYNNYDPSMITKGDRIEQLYTASLLLDNVIVASSMKSSEFISLKSKSLQDEIIKLNESIKKAEIDEVDVTAEKALLESKLALLKSSVSNVSLLDESITQLSQARSSIYERASLQYSNLNPLRTKLFSLVNSLSNYYDVYQYKIKLNNYEKFISGDEFNPEKTLGNYKTISADYNSILNDLNKNSASILSKYLSNKYSTITSFDSVPTVDKFTNITTYIKLTNDLALGSNSQIVVSIKGIPFSQSSTVKSDVNAYAIKEGDAVNIYLPSIKEDTTINLEIHSLIKPASLVSKSTKRLTLTNEKLVEEITYNIDSSFDIGSLRLEDEYSSDKCSVFMNNRMQSVIAYSNLTLSLSNVKQGKQTIIATCTKNNPISASSSQFTNSDNKVSYILSLKSNYGDLKDVEYILEISGSADEIQSDSIRVYGPAGQIPDKFQFYKSNNKFYAKWLIPVISSSEVNYTISYSTTDIVAYYSKLKQEIENLSLSESIDVSNYIRDASYHANRGKYDNAINSLEQAKKQITQTQVQRLEKISLTERLDKLSSQISSLKNKSNEIYEISTNLSLSDISVEVAKQIAEFDSQEKSARNYLNKGDMNNAKSIISQLERMVSSTKIDNAIYQKEKKLLDSLSIQEKKAINLAKFSANSSELFSDLNKIKEHISLISPSTAVQDYYSALINLNNASILISALDDKISNYSIDVDKEFNLRLDLAKSVLDSWKKNKQTILNSFTTLNNSITQYVPDSIKQIQLKINDTDASVSELNVLYSKLKQQKLDDRLQDMDEFDRLQQLSTNISQDIKYYDQLINSYKSVSNDMIKDISILLEDKINKGSDDEKKKAIELQPVFAQAKDSHMAGKYLNSISSLQYIKNSLLATAPKEQGFDFMLIIYIGIVILSLAIVYFVLSKKEPPKSEKRIERIKLD